MNRDIFRSFLSYCAEHRPQAPRPVRLPAGYTEIDYVDSNAQEMYIDTGLKADPNDRYVAWACPNLVTIMNRPIFGDSNTKSDSHVSAWVNPGTEASFNFGNGNDSKYIVLVKPKKLDGTNNTGTNYEEELACWHKYELNLSSQSVYIDDVLIGTAQKVQSYANAKKMVFFGSWRGSAIFNYWMGAMGEFIMYRSGVEIRHFVPCVRDSDGKVGYYDICGSSSPMNGNPFYTSSVKNKNFLRPPVGKPMDDIQFSLRVTNFNEKKRLFTSAVSGSQNMTYVDWGDGSEPGRIMPGTTVIYHTYAEPGIYNVQMSSGGFNYGTTNFLNIYKANPARIFRMRGCAKISEYFIYRMGLSTTVASDALGYGTKEIGAQAFRACTGINELALPDSIETIADSAFYECSNLKTSRLPARLKTIGTTAMRGCGKITVSEIPAGVTSIGSSAFYQCSSMPSLSISSASLTTIGEHAFYQCGASEINISAPSLTTIGNNCFKGCGKLVSAYLNVPSLTSIGSESFTGCTKLRHLYVSWSEGDFSLSGLPASASIHYNYF